MLSAAYPTYPVGEDTLDLYVEALMSRDANATLEAVRGWIRNQPQFPRISDLLAAVRSEQTRIAARTPRPELEEPARPRLSLDEIRAMRPKGLDHGRHRTPRGHREGTST